MCAGLFLNELLFVAIYLNEMPEPHSLARPVWHVNPLAESCSNIHDGAYFSMHVVISDQFGFISRKNIFGCTERMPLYNCGRPPMTWHGVIISGHN